MEGEEVGPVLDHHGRLGPHTQVAQAGGIIFCELCQGLVIHGNFRSQRFETHLQDFVACGEEVRVVGTFGCDVAVTLQRRFKVAIGLSRVAQFHQAHPLFLQSQIEGLGVNDRGSEISDLVEMPNQQFREHHVVRVRLDRPEQGHTHEFPIVLDGGQPQIAVEAVLDGTQVVGLGAQQGHVRVDHAFEVASHALKVGEFVVETNGAEFFRAFIGGKRHVEFVQLDEGVGQGDRSRTPGLQAFKRLCEGLHGLVTLVKMHVQRPQVHQRRRPGVFVPSLQSGFDDVFCGVEIIQRQQRGVVHLVDRIGFVLLPNALEVKLGLRIAPFVEIVFGQLHVRLGEGIRSVPQCQQPCQQPSRHAPAQLASLARV